jgi:hypothetical protein
MVATFIEPESLLAIRGRYLFYPAAGSDWNELLTRFSDYVDEFYFCDLAYNELEHVPAGLNREDSPGAVYEGFYRH